MLLFSLLLLIINRFDYYRRLLIMIKMHIQQPWTDASAGDRQLSEWQAIVSGRASVATPCLANKPTM